jgi:hypothetical protein
MIQGAHIFLKKEVKQNGGFLLQVVALILGRFLHYFTVFDQCFNGRQFLMEISVNRIIITGCRDK